MKNQFIKSIFFVCLSMSSLFSFSQDINPENPFGDPGTPAAPINSYIYIMIIIGSVLMYFNLKKNKKNDIWIIFGSVASNVMKNFIFLYLQQKDVQRSLFS